MDRCTECDDCAEVCTVCRVVDGDVYSPRSKIQLISKLEEGKILEEEELDSLYLCMMCGQCDEACPEDIPLSDVIKYNRGLVAVRGEEPEKTKHIINNIIEEKNPGGYDNTERQEWVSSELEFSEDSKIGYMAGCWISFKYPEIARDTVRILNEGDIQPQLIDEEKCCGLFVTDSGHMAELELYAKDYTEEIESQGIETLIVSCPACYGQMNDMYPRLYRDPEFDVKMSMEIYQDLINKDKLNFEKEIEGEEEAEDVVSLKHGCPITHMSDLPHDLIEETGIESKDLFGQETVCCGAPAGVKPNYPDIADEMGDLAVDKAAEQTGSMVTLCPFCQYHYDGLDSIEEKDINMTDISSLLAEKINKK